MMDIIAIFVAKYLFLASLLISGIYFLKQKHLRKRILALSAISLPLAAFGAFILHHIYFNPRPFVVGKFVPLVSHVADNGFASDHALFTSLIAAILYTCNRRIGIFLFIVSFLISISRVYLGLHHAVDVIAGTFLGIAVVALVQALIKRFISERIL